jgi:hypothetical protein
MIQYTNKVARLPLQTAVITGMVVLLAINLVSFKTRQAYGDLWQQLGVQQDRGTSSIKESFLQGYLYHYSARNIKNIALNDRAALTKDLLAYTKEYVQGEPFQKDYAAYRLSKKPQEPEAPKTADQVRQSFIDGAKQGIENLEKGLKTASEDMKKTLKETLDMFKQQLKDYQDPNNEMIKMAVQGNKIQYDNNMLNYKEELKKWETAFPATAKAFVKLRLQQMLEVTANVDYAAQLTERNGKKYFVKPEYERKPSNWKTAFRAGREVTETARTFVKQWVAE